MVHLLRAALPSQELIDYAAEHEGLNFSAQADWEHIFGIEPESQLAAVTLADRIRDFYLACPRPQQSAVEQQHRRRELRRLAPAVRQCLWPRRSAPRSRPCYDTHRSGSSCGAALVV